MKYIMRTGLNRKNGRGTALILLAAVLVSFSQLLAYASYDVTLAWDPSPDPDIAGYIVHYGNATGTYPVTTNVGPATVAKVGGLAGGQSYFFVVTAYDSSGLQSDPSNEVSYTPPAIDQTPTDWPASLGWEIVALKNTTVNIRSDILFSGIPAIPGTGVFLAGIDRRSQGRGWTRLTSDGAICYRPPVDFTGLDSFSYGLSNAAGATLVRTALVHVVVTAAQVPTLTLLQPAAPVVISPTGELPLSATLYDTNRTIAWVEFYANSSIMTSMTNQVGNNVQTVWPNALSGSYWLSATAYTTDGQIVGSSPFKLAFIGLTNPPLSGLTRLVIESSSDMTDWSVIRSFVRGPAGQDPAFLPGAYNVGEGSATPARFYRLRSLDL